MFIEYISSHYYISLCSHSCFEFNLKQILGSVAEGINTHTL